MKTLLLSLIVAALWNAAIPEAVRAELKVWKVGGEELSWKSQERSSAQVDFSVPGALQINGFEAEDNIVQLLDWEEGSPPNFVSERARAYIWDNVPLKESNLPILDGDPSTSSEDRFKVFGASQAGTAFFLDLGARFPVNRIVFFPRQAGEDDEGRPFKDDFIRGYEILANNGLDFNERDRPIYTLMSRVEFTRESIAEILFPLQFIRYIRLSVATRNPFEIAEIQVFGTGFAPKGQYLSEVVDLGEAANYNRLEWEVAKLRREADRIVAAPDAAAGGTVQMRTGADDTPYVYYEITDLFTRERQEVSESEYNKLSEEKRGPIEEDQVDWSLWSFPFAGSENTIELPSPRRYFQFRSVLESRTILDGVQVKSLGVEYAVPPLAQQLIGEISLLDNPRPRRNVAVVPASTPSTFAYDLITDIQASDVGFDAIRISTPSQPKFSEFLIGDPPVSADPDSVMEAPDALTLFFPSHRVESRSSGILRIVFEAQVFVQGTFFNAEVFDTQTGELPQRVFPGDANPVVGTNTLRVLTSVESIEHVLPFLEIVPRVISPNGDGSNDWAQISFSLVQLLRAIDAEVEIFDLGGRRVRRVFSGEAGSGLYAEMWDGRNESGELLPAGIYVVKVSAHTERGDFVRTGTMGVVY